MMYIYILGMRRLPRSIHAVRRLETSDICIYVYNICIYMYIYMCVYILMYIYIQDTRRVPRNIHAVRRLEKTGCVVLVDDTALRAPSCPCCK